MELRLIAELALAVIAAFFGGLAARRLRLPVIFGYLVAGMAIGALGVGARGEGSAIPALAELGVAFLMFALGTEFARSELRELGRVAALGGTVQVGGVLLLGALAAPALGLTAAQGVYLGALVALSSTVVALKLLQGRGEAQALHGRTAIALLVAQDVAVVPMVILLPSLGPGLDGGGLAVVADRTWKAVALVAGAYAIGTRVVPWLLGHAAGLHTRELFLVGVVALALGTAVATDIVGLSAAFGAFVAGLVLAESEYRSQVLAEVLPLRDLFTSLFFVSMGLLVDVSALVERPMQVALVVVLVVLAKPLVAAVAVVLVGLPAHVGLLAGGALAQMGEFSFVLARIGVDAGVLPTWLFDLVIATAVVTIVLAPLALRAPEALLPLLERAPRVGRLFAPPVDPGTPSGARGRHVVICGFGRVARELGDALERRGFRYVVIEYNPAVVRELRARGVEVIYGDAANPQVLEHAGIDDAVLVAVLVRDPRTAEAATRYARAHGPRISIVARAASVDDVGRLAAAGATDVVQPEFEAGVEVIRYSLGRLGVSGLELQHLAAGRRASFYRREPE